MGRLSVLLERVVGRVVELLDKVELPFDDAAEAMVKDVKNGRVDYGGDFYALVRFLKSKPENAELSHQELMLLTARGILAFDRQIMEYGYDKTLAENIHDLVREEAAKVSNPSPAVA